MNEMSTEKQFKESNNKTKKLKSNQKPEKYSVNYSISYGVDVTKQEIDQQRALFDNEHTHFNIWNITITKDSSDKEIVKFIALENPKDREVVDLDDLEIEAY